ncbi:hypothetical protein [Nitratireductor sp. StC3]|uniref:ArnT family glycosyltransferase n=1 Tax=Nitratireductor sp. StC3 TaxID=2126741 RepID=UPI001304C70F|nr:hypothetical protein [Nitratireductor sp. StC3]
MERSATGGPAQIRAEPLASRWAGRAWGWALAHPYLAISALVLLQTVPALWARELWWLDELRHAAVLSELLDHGHWLALFLNGEFYPDKPAGYFWLLAALSLGAGTQAPWIHFLAVAIGAVMMANATVWLARIVAPDDRRLALVAGIVLVTGLFFVERMHYPRMDPHFGAFIAWSLGAFFIALSRPLAIGWTVAAFVFAACAVLVKGPVGFVFPLLTALAWLVWRGRPSRLFRVDVACGLAVFAAILGLYGFGLYRAQGAAYLQALAGDVGTRTMADAFRLYFHLPHYVFMLAYRWLPWTLLLLVLPWTGLLSALRPARLGAARTAGDGGYAFLVLSVVAPLLVLTFLRYVSMNFLLCFYPALAVLTGRVVLDLGPRRAAWFRSTVAGLFVLGVPVMIVIAWRNYYDFFIVGNLVAALVLAPFAFGLWRWRMADWDRWLPMLALTVATVSLPHFLLTLPALDIRKSTRPACEAARPYLEAGWNPLVLRPGRWSGVFQYYCGRRIPEIVGWDALLDEIAGRDKVVVLMQEGAWAQLEPNPGGFRLIGPPGARFVAVACEGCRR